MALHFTGQISTGFEPIEPNDYETVISLEYKKTNAGDLYINCRFTIREDVEQDFQRRIVFDGIYKSKTTGEFSPQKINALLAAVNANEDKPQWDFEDYDDLIQYLNGKLVKITVEIQKADVTTGTSDKNVVKYLSYKPTEYKHITYATPITQNDEAVFDTPKPQQTETKQETKEEGFSFDIDDLPF